MNKHVWPCLTVAVLLVCCTRGSVSIGTPLDDYVHKVDPYYRWSDTGKRLTGFLPWAKWEGAVLDMTSQEWLSPAETDCSVWTHDLVVVRPGHYDHTKTALLLVGDGYNGDTPSSTDELLILAATVAVKTKSLVAIVYQVPNQPCYFTAEHPKRARFEDDLIAYTWAHFLDYPDQTEWPLRLPMTKAVLRAMDTVQSFASEAYNTMVENFVLTGASKRGWAAWVAAAVDDRIVGTIPIVMDVLNFNPNMHHFYQALGGWPLAFKSYYDLNMTARIDTPEFSQLMAIVDPYSYRDRLTMPKLIISTSNDEFFLIDDSDYFWNDLPGEKHLLILSNTEHTLITGIPKLLVAVEAFFLSIAEGHELSSTNKDPYLKGTSLLQMPGENGLQERRPGYGGRPKYWWYINKAAGTIEVGVAEKPTKVILWYAYTGKGATARDFRWFSKDNGNCLTIAIKGYCIHPVFFRRRTIKPCSVDSDSGRRTYVASIPFPEEGYGAFYVELRFSGPKVLTPFVFTTGPVVLPDMLPFEDCHGEMCKGILV
ncbi:unnamed protein product [Calypogeia fissa]